MFGVVLAAGTATRLKPISLFINKNILPVGEKPAIYYPISTLVKSGIKNILIIIGPPFGKQVIRVVKDLKRYFQDISIEFVWQTKPLGMPDAISYASPFVGKRPIIVIAGDNIIGGNYKNYIKNFKEGGISFLRKVDNPSDFACPVYDKKKKLIDIVEKPKKPQTSYAITGPHLFDNQVFAYIKTLRPSGRAELEIVDLHKVYLRLKKLKLIKKGDYWADIGTFENLAKASYYLLTRNNSFKKK